MSHPTSTPQQRGRRRNQRHSKEVSSSNSHPPQLSPALVGEDSTEQSHSHEHEKAHAISTGSRSRLDSTNKKSAKRKTANLTSKNEQLSGSLSDSPQNRRRAEQVHESDYPGEASTAFYGIGAGNNQTHSLTHEPKINHEQILIENPQRNSSTPSKQVYAGPLFHASPAASALPLPRKFSKSVPPQVSAQSPATAANTHDAGKTVNVFDPPATRPSQSSKANSGESPLDIFFHAQKTEQKKSSIFNTSPLRGPQSLTQDQNRQLSEPISSRPRTCLLDYQVTPESRRAGKEALPVEVDGAPDESESEEPGVAIPFKDRLNALHGPDHATPATDESEERQAKSEALKRLLMKPSDGRVSSPSESAALPPEQAYAAPFSPKSPYAHAATDSRLGVLPASAPQESHSPGAVDGTPNFVRRNQESRHIASSEASGPWPSHAKEVKPSPFSSLQPDGLNLSPRTAQDSGFQSSPPDASSQAQSSGMAGSHAGAERRTGLSDLQALESNLQKVLKLED